MLLYEPLELSQSKRQGPAGPQALPVLASPKPPEVLPSGWEGSVLAPAHRFGLLKTGPSRMSQDSTPASALAWQARGALSTYREPQELLPGQLS